MDNLNYSIIYGVIRPEISEQLSSGLIMVDNVNNLIAISALQDIDLESSQESQDWLYHNYVCASA